MKLKNSSPGLRGPTLIELIQKQMDKRRIAMEDKVIQKGVEAKSDSGYLINKGRYEGMAASLAILRSSSIGHEISRSNERLGIE